MVEATPALRAQPWYKSWKRERAAPGVVLVPRSGRSAIILFEPRAR
jgi:hypothetical protein